MERKTSTRFTKRGTWSRIDGTITTKYGCNRARGDGDLVDPLEQRQRFRRTERIHKYCPAFFVVRDIYSTSTVAFQFPSILAK